MLFEVGKKIMEPCADSAKFDITEDGAVLVVCYNRPTEKEIDAFSKEIEFKYTVVSGIIFILLKPEGQNWLDMPYNRELSKGTLIFDKLPEGLGLPVHIMVVDAGTGVLKYQRFVGLSTRFTNALYKEICKQGHIDDYNAALSQVYAKYTTQQLVKFSGAERCRFEKGE